MRTELIIILKNVLDEIVNFNLHREKILFFDNFRNMAEMIFDSGRVAGSIDPLSLLLKITKVPKNTDLFSLRIII